MRFSITHILFSATFLLCAPLAFARAGTQTFSTPGSHTFTVPNYETMTVEVWGGGGGGSGSAYPGYSMNGWHIDKYPGTAGSVSSFGDDIKAFGGGGGTNGWGFTVGRLDPGSYPGLWHSINQGSGGSASGGDENIQGGNGVALPCVTYYGYSAYPGGRGGTSNKGGIGGLGAGDCSRGLSWTYMGGLPGGSPGGGGGGGYPYIFLSASHVTGVRNEGAGGGAGGYSKKTYTRGELTPGGTINIVVGSGGAGGRKNSYGFFGIAGGGDGSAGQVRVIWTEPSVTCSLSSDVNPKPYNTPTKLRWTSTNASKLSISNIGSVTPVANGSQSVNPQATTTYTGTANGQAGSATCSHTLTVLSPSSCSFNESTVAHGGSVIAYDVESVPRGTRPHSERRECNDGTLSGSYAFSSYSVVPPCELVSEYVCFDDIVQERRTTARCEYEYTDLETCAFPYTCAPGARECALTEVTGSLNVENTLVPSGEGTTLIWDTQNAVRCEVRGNDRMWEGLRDAVSTESITDVESFSLLCDGHDSDDDLDDLSISVQVFVLPEWEEI